MKTLLAFAAGALLLCGCTASDRRDAQTMADDEASIRQFYDNWIRATTEGDLELARSLIDDDAVFLVPGAGEFDKETFAAGATASDPNLDFELESSIREMQVMGDNAWLWTEFSLVIIDKRSGTRSKSAGHTLSVLKRSGDSWVTVREANTMAAVPEG
ncbi:MAG: nuclear transport factor 2 family protein [Planctomycetota bacterium]